MMRLRLALVCLVGFALTAASQAAGVDALKEAISACLSGSSLGIKSKVEALGGKPLPQAEVDRLYINVLQGRVPIAVRSPSTLAEGVMPEPEAWSIGQGPDLLRVTAIANPAPQSGVFCQVFTASDRGTDAVADITATLGEPLNPIFMAGHRTLVWPSKSGKVLPRASMMLATLPGRVYTSIFFYPQ